MAKTPKKDINLYPLVVAPKKNTMKKGVLFAVIGVAAAVAFVGSFVGVKLYVNAQLEQVAEMEAKANDASLMEKIENANAVVSDINILRTAGNAYAKIGKEIYGTRSYSDDFSDDLIEKLVGCETYQSMSAGEVRIATITALAYDGETLSITANSADSQDVSAFVTNLTRLGLFSDISYTGYSLSENVYTYTVNAVFVTHNYETTTGEAAAGGTTETTTEVAAQ